MLGGSNGCGEERTNCMKKCPICGQIYDNIYTKCRDGGRLMPTTEISSPLPARELARPKANGARAFNREGMSFVRIMIRSPIASARCLAGVAVMCLQAASNHNEQLLETAGQRTAGMLQNVTVNRVNWVVQGYTFEVQYSGISKKFRADGELFEKNTLTNNKFTRHPITCIFLQTNRKWPNCQEWLGQARAGIGRVLGWYCFA